MTAAEWGPDPYIDTLIQPSGHYTGSAAVTPEGRRPMSDPSRMTEAGRVAALKSRAIGHISKFYPPWLKRTLTNEVEVLGTYLWEMDPSGIIRNLEEILSWPPAEFRDNMAAEVKRRAEVEKATEKVRRLTRPDPGDLTVEAEAA